jgi:L-rhamnose mutarotase
MRNRSFVFRFHRAFLNTRPALRGRPRFSGRCAQDTKNTKLGVLRAFVFKFVVGKSALGHLFLLTVAVLVLQGCSTPKVQRFGSVIGLEEESAEQYKELHANTWPEILQNLDEANIHNYSIYLTRMDDGKLYLFSYFEYTGSDMDTDFKNLAEGPRTKEWWALTEPMQRPLENRSEGEWWKNMDEVFHAD